MIGSALCMASSESFGIILCNISWTDPAVAVAVAPEAEATRRLLLLLLLLRVPEDEDAFIVVVVVVDDTRTDDETSNRKDGRCSRWTRSFDPSCESGRPNMHRHRCMLRLAIGLKFCRIIIAIIWRKRK